MLAVATVIMNRVESSRFPNSISGVIYQSGQFTPARSGKLARVLSNGKISSSCYQAAAEALGDDGRILVRESGTEPLIRVMVEAGTDDLCHKYVDSVVDVMEAEGLVVE